MMTSEGLAQASEERKGITGCPQAFIIELIRPQLVLYTQRQTSATTTAGTRIGMKKMVRNRGRAFILLFSSEASRKAVTKARGTPIKTMNRVLRRRKKRRQRNKLNLKKKRLPKRRKNKRLRKKLQLSQNRVQMKGKKKN